MLLQLHNFGALVTITFWSGLTMSAPKADIGLPFHNNSMKNLDMNHASSSKCFDLREIKTKLLE
jgi:hypothetical protein